MNRLAIPLSILAVATVAACAAPVQQANVIPPQPAIQPQPVGYQAGTGVVQAVMAAPPRMGAAAGGSAATKRPETPVGMETAPSGRMIRLAIKMDRSGTMQYVDTDATDFRPGMRVELTPDGKIRPL
jgi:hypothetical protein